MASFSCQNCGFTGERPATGACPGCGNPASTGEFRVPPLPSPNGVISSEVDPARESAPPGGYLELDLGDGGRAEPGPSPGGAPHERRRQARKSGPAFAAVAPKEQPGSPRSAMPIFIGVGVGCVALILAGVMLSRGTGEPASSPAQTAAAPTPEPPPAPAPIPAPATQPPAAPAAQRSPDPTVLAAPAEPPPAAPSRRAEARNEPRTGRRAEKAEKAAAVTAASRAGRAPAPAVQAPPPAAPIPAPQAPPPPPVPSQPAVIEDAPRYASEGFRRPQLADPQCVMRSIRAPRDLASRVEGPVTIRFAVGPDGDVSLFQIMGDVPDPRLPGLLESAVRACKFLPGADAQGTPVRMWVAMPIRFAR